jgi:hypothetical protein
MPLGAATVVTDAKLRLVVLGAPKVGKSTTVISTSPAPVYVIATDGSASALQGAARLTDKFEYDVVTNSGELTRSLKTAAEGAKSGKYATVVLDTLSSIASIIEEEELEASNTSGKGPDGRRAYKAYGQKIRYLVRSMFKLPCHVVITSHFIDLGEGVDGKAKQGRGIFPLLAGSARETVAALCHDVVFLELAKDGTRQLVANPVGVWGAGMKSVAAANVELPPDISKLIDYIAKKP